MARNFKFVFCILALTAGMLTCSDKTVKQENGFIAGMVAVEGAGVSGVTISVSSYTTSSGTAKKTVDYYSARVSAAGQYRIELLEGVYRIDFDLILDGEILHTARYPIGVVSKSESIVNVDLKDPVPQNLIAADDDASVLLSWEHGYGASSYNIYRSKEADHLFSLVAIIDSAIGTVRYTDSPPEVGAYIYKVSAISNQIESSPSEEVEVMFTGNISPPSGFTATDNVTHISLDWITKRFAVYYKIYRAVGNPAGEWALLDSTAQSSYQDVPGEYNTYSYYVTAVSYLDTESQPSAIRPVEYDGLFDPPSGVVLLDRGSNLYLTWLEEDNVSHYNIYRSRFQDSLFARIDSTLNHYYEDFPSVFGQYFYSVTIVGPNGLESDKSDVVGAYFDGRLDPPDQVYATDLGLSVRVSWSEVLWAGSYIVYRSDDGGATYNQLARVSGEDNEYIDIPPASGNYLYKIKTETIDGIAGALSLAASVYFSDNLPSPVNVSAENFGTFVEITWSDIPEADGYTIHRSTAPNSGYSQLGSSVDTVYTDIPQSAGSYYYKIKATDTLGHESQYSFYAFVYFTDVPQAPFNVNATDMSYKVGVSWESIDSSFIFIIYRSNLPAGDYNPLDTVEAVLEFTDWPPAEGHYYYKIQAEHPSHGSSDLSQYGHVFFSGVLESPSNLTATDEGTYISLTWDPVDGAAEYEVFRGIDITNLEVIQTVYTASTNDVPPVAGTYYYAVLAITQGGLKSPRTAPVGVVFNP